MCDRCEMQNLVCIKPFDDLEYVWTFKENMKKQAQSRRYQQLRQEMGEEV